MIYLIITTSIYSLKDPGKQGSYDLRKKLYLERIKQTLSYLPNTIKPIIVENNNLKESYLDSLNIDVYYTNNNSKYPNKHKGYNELHDIKDVARHYNIQDDDFIIKITGRYCLNNTSFVDLVIAKEKNYDIFMKFFNVCTGQYLENDCVLGLYAVKWKYLKLFEYSESFAEIDFASFFRKFENIKIYEVKDLGLTFCFNTGLQLMNI
jgi:hypothetical protein